MSKDAEAESRKKREKLREEAVAALLPKGEPETDASRAEFLDLYKMMVASSEALVNRRQGVNTFFLTINGLLLTTLGLIVRGGVTARLQAGGVVIIALAGLLLCWAWRSLLISFGQLNRGKFVIINSMEKRLSASVYSGEWAALDEGRDPAIYRSFTEREALIPFVVGFVYAVAFVLSLLVFAGCWKVK